ncbi:MAG: signal peptidase II [Alphaproteobacteria bacterium]|nr:signal peptidase II [Alphaproteobacteria bacterium]
MKKILKNTFVLIGIFILLDFLTKLLVLAQTPFPITLFGYYKKYYPTYYPISEPLPFFNLILVWNNGVSFSMLANNTLLGRFLLIGLSLLITTYIAILLRHEKENLNRFAYILIIAGALGNIFDRLRYGAVIDFLDFYIGTHHYPAFNVADMYICIGVAIIIFKSFIKKK